MPVELPFSTFVATMKVRKGTLNDPYVKMMVQNQLEDSIRGEGITKAVVIEKEEQPASIFPDDILVRWTLYPL